MKIVKQYGLMRSGTNFAEIVFTSNYDVEFLSYDTTGSKHARPLRKKLIPKPDFILLCVKDPYAWIDSIFRRFVQKGKLKIGTFRPWLERALERPPKTIDCRRTPMDVWNEFNRYWLDCDVAPVHVLKSEDTLRVKDLKKTFNKLARAMGIKRVGPGWEIPSFYVRSSTKVRPKAFRPAYYLERKYMARFGKDLAVEVGKRLDTEVMGRLGYEPTGS